jgi:glyoxylase-like metal-dependent hydrolase (beta-lactamase superfamily II)
MALPDTIHAFPQSMEREGETVTIHPAAVETPRGVVLLDVGFPGLLDQVSANLADAGFEWADVSAIFLTHHDGDHAGALEAVLERTDATVYAHEACAPHVDGREDTVKSPAGQRYPPAPVDVELVGGERFRTDAGPMEVHFTPGHTAGHCSLYFPDEAVLVAADALTADEDGLAGPSQEFTLDMEQALDSAAALADLDIEQILCFHGGLVAATGQTIADVVAQRR